MVLPYKVDECVSGSGICEPASHASLPQALDELPLQQETLSQTATEASAAAPLFASALSPTELGDGYILGSASGTYFSTPLTSILILLTLDDLSLDVNINQDLPVITAYPPIDQNQTTSGAEFMIDSNSGNF